MMKKYILEYNMKNAPLALLWNYITTDNGLREWFADDVVINGKEYTFFWNGSSQSAKIIASRNGMYVRLRWKDGNPAAFFEMRISKNELADHTTLTITDFADEDELTDQKSLWDSEVETLRRLLGC